MANVNLENDAEEDLDDDIEDESASVGEADINSMDTEGGMLIFPNDLQGVELDSPTKAVITQVLEFLRIYPQTFIDTKFFRL